MSMKRRAGERQEGLWIVTSDLARTAGHPFYERLNSVLKEASFDRFVEDQCEEFYTRGNGRPSIPPSVYVRMLLVGFFEGLESERGIAWRCNDSLSLRQFLGFGLTESTPEHSTLSRIRQRLPLEVHQVIFTSVLKILAEKGLLKAETIGIDGTTLEANAALKSIVRKDTGASYQEFLTELAKQSGIETPTREDLTRIDRKRAKKGSNDEWKSPNDPDARITKMKDGRTHLAHKSEHAVDMDSGAVLAVTVQPANSGDTTTVLETLKAAAENVVQLQAHPELATPLGEQALSTLVADKGYHSNDTLELIDQSGIKSYISEPARGQRQWAGQADAKRAVYANRRRMRTRRGKRLMRKRGELIERTFAHCLETGAMRRVHLRGRENILKRYLVHVAAFNLSLVMRKLIGVGTPRSLQSGLCAALDVLAALSYTMNCLMRCLREARLNRPHHGVRIQAA